MALMVGTGLDTVHPPALAQASIQFEEGYEIGRFVNEDVQPGGSVGAPVVASGGTGTLTYSLSGTDAASFTINTGTGQILLAQGASFDYESEKTTYRLVVTATGQPGETASVDVVIYVENVDEPPEFDIDNIFFESFEVKENTAANTNLGYPITAIDPEGGDVTYSLAGTDAALFDVDDSGGQVKTKGSLNYEAASSYTVAFTASDPQSNSASIDLTIMVKDVNTEAPGKPAKPSVSPNPGTDTSRWPSRGPFPTTRAPRSRVTSCSTESRTRATNGIRQRLVEAVLRPPFQSLSPVPSTKSRYEQSTTRVKVHGQNPARQRLWYRLLLIHSLNSTTMPSLLCQLPKTHRPIRLSGHPLLRRIQTVRTC